MICIAWMVQQKPRNDVQICKYASRMLCIYMPFSKLGNSNDRLLVVHYDSPVMLGCDWIDKSIIGNC